jgi:hypothetical protein
MRKLTKSYLKKMQQVGRITTDDGETYFPKSRAAEDATAGRPEAKAELHEISAILSAILAELLKITKQK